MFTPEAGWLPVLVEAPVRHEVWPKTPGLLCAEPLFSLSRTIRNSGLRSIQPRAFAKNPHLRYM